MAKRKSTAVVTPNLGLYLNRPAIDVPVRALIDGHNFRIKNGKLENLNIGWTRLSDDWELNGAVMKIDSFFPRTLENFTLFVTPSDIYLYDGDTDTVSFLTPRYATGTAAANGTTVTGTGTTWTTNAEAGDFISFGDAAETDPNATWYEIANVGGDTTITLTDTAGIVADGPYTIRKVFAGNFSDRWSTTIFVGDGTSGDDLWFATNGVDDVVTWNGTDTQVTPHPELGFTCTTVAVFANMLIYGNVTDADSYPTSIINSDVGLPLNAGDTGTGLSEQFRVHDGSDGILAMDRLGDYLVIYSEDHLVTAQFVGSDLVFLFRTAITGHGVMSGQAYANFGDFHQFVSPDGEFMFDGVTVREINTHVWRYVVRQIDPTRKRHVYSLFDEDNGDLIWSVPSSQDAGAGTITSAPEVAWSEHYLEDVPEPTKMPHSKRDFPFTASGHYERAAGLTWDTVEGTWADFNFSWNDQFFSQAFPQILVGDADGIIYVLNDGQEGNGEALPSYVHFGRFSLGDGRRRGLLARVYPFASQLVGDLTVKVWLSDHAAGQEFSGGTYALDMALPEGGHFVTPYRRARYVELQFGTDGHSWQLSGYDTDMRDGGMR